MAFSKLSMENELKDFDKAYNTIVQDFLSSVDLKNNRHLSSWVSKVMKYNVPDGKKFRGLMTVLAYKTMSESVNPEDLKRAQVLGWCVEILQAAFLVLDDIMDFSQKRRGKPCWYKVSDVGLNAINDAFLLENSIYLLMSKYFEGKNLYTFSELFRTVTLKTTFGQTLDLRTPMEKNFENYTIEAYSDIVMYKTSFYTIYLPTMLGATMAGLTDPEELHQIEEIVFRLGHYFQAQDDYLDCFGDVKVTGKIGTDIEDSKCSWLIIKALQKADENQKRELERIYWNGASANDNVKKIFQDLELEKEYQEFEEKELNVIEKMISNLKGKGKKSQTFLRGFLQLLHNRKA